MKRIMGKKEEEMPWQIVRTYSAGVFAGFVEKRDWMEVTMRKAIRLWRWEGAASLSQLAMEGVKVKSGCKFGVPVDRVILTQAIEILDVTPEARKNIESVKSWVV